MACWMRCIGIWCGSRLGVRGRGGSCDVVRHDEWVAAPIRSNVGRVKMTLPCVYGCVPVHPPTPTASLHALRHVRPAGPKRVVNIIADYRKRGERPIPKGFAGHGVEGLSRSCSASRGQEAYSCGTG